MPRKQTIKPEERPAPRERTISVPVDRELYEATVKRAGGRHRLPAWIRALLRMGADDELPFEVPEELIEQESRRARKR